MKALSLWEPWATLFALGIKGPETRSWSTNYRGPMAIAAAKTMRGIDELPGDCEGKTEAGWRYGYLGEFQAGWCYRTSDEGRRGSTFLVRLSRPEDAFEVELAPGMLVATAALVDCVPTERIAWDEGADADAERPWMALLGDAVVVLPATFRAYGDYSPGRFAWLFAEVRPAPKGIAVRGRQGLWEWEWPELAPSDVTP